LLRQFHIRTPTRHDTTPHGPGLRSRFSNSVLFFSVSFFSASNLRSTLAWWRLHSCFLRQRRETRKARTLPCLLPKENKTPDFTLRYSCYTGASENKRLLLFIGNESAVSGGKGDLSIQHFAGPENLAGQDLEYAQITQDEATPKVPAICAGSMIDRC
jgi:hypothetical protein